jgi:hypothetical protein
MARHGLPREGRAILRDQHLALAGGVALPADVAEQPDPAHRARHGQPGRVAESQKPSVSNSVASQGMTVSVLSAIGSSAVSLTMAPRTRWPRSRTRSWDRPRRPGCRSSSARPGTRNNRRRPPRSGLRRGRCASGCWIDRSEIARHAVHLEAVLDDLNPAIAGRAGSPLHAAQYLDPGDALAGRHGEPGRLGTRIGKSVSVIDLAPDPRNRVHALHPPTTRSKTRAGSPREPRRRGSKLDADPPAQGVNIACRFTS